MNELKEKITADDLESKTADQRIDWVIKKFSKTNFYEYKFWNSKRSNAAYDNKKIPTIPVVFIDTGYLFPETYEFANTLIKKLKLNVLTYKSLVTPAEQESKYGKLWEQGLNGLNKYNYLNKVEPMKRAIKELGRQVWLAGIRRDQSQSREEKSVLEIQNNITKIYPIID